MNKYKDQEKSGMRPEKPFSQHVNAAMGLCDPCLDGQKAQFEALDHDKNECVKISDFQNELQNLVDAGVVDPSDVAAVMAEANKRGYVWCTHVSRSLPCRVRACVRACVRVNDDFTIQPIQTRSQNDIEKNKPKRRKCHALSPRALAMFTEYRVCLRVCVLWCGRCSAGAVGFDEFRRALESAPMRPVQDLFAAGKVSSATNTPPGSLRDLTCPHCAGCVGLCVLFVYIQGVSRILCCGAVDPKNSRAQISCSRMCSKQALKQTKLSQEEAREDILVLAGPACPVRKFSGGWSTCEDRTENMQRRECCGQLLQNSKDKCLDGKCQASHHQNVAS